MIRYLLIPLSALAAFIAGHHLGRRASQLEIAELQRDLQSADSTNYTMALRNRALASELERRHLQAGGKVIAIDYTNPNLADLHARRQGAEAGPYARVQQAWGPPNAFCFEELDT